MIRETLFHFEDGGVVQNKPGKLCSEGKRSMAYLAAVSSSTMPIFIRTKGDVPPVSELFGSLAPTQTPRPSPPSPSIFSLPIPPSFLYPSLLHDPFSPSLPPSPPFPTAKFPHCWLATQYPDICQQAQGHSAQLLHLGCKGHLEAVL